MDDARIVTLVSRVVARDARAGLPVPALPSTQAAAAVTCFYAVTTVDARGRLADRFPVRRLGWLPGRPINATISAGAVHLTAGGTGGLAVTKQGHVRVPAEARHAVGLHDGDRVLAVARPDLDAVIVYPMPVVAEALRLYDASAVGLRQ